MQAGQFDLELAFVASCPLGKDLENQQSPVIDRQSQVTLQVALLRGAQGLVKQDLGGTGALGQQLDFVGLARSHEQGRIGRAALAGDPARHAITGGFGQQTQFEQFPVEMGHTEIDPDQDDRWRSSGWVSVGIQMVET